MASTVELATLALAALAALRRRLNGDIMADVPGGITGELAGGIETLPLPLEALLPPGAAPGVQGSMRDPAPVNLEVASRAYKVLEANADRKKYAIQNLGPGTVRVVRTDRTTGGWTILPDGFWSDDPPYAHGGDVYCWSDVANTTVIVGEWT